MPLAISIAHTHHAVKYISCTTVRGVVGMPRIDAITFDLWDTLIQEKPGGSTVVAKLRLDEIERLLLRNGTARPREDLEEAYAQTGKFLERVWSRAEDVSVDEQVEFFLESLESGLASSISSVAKTQITKTYSESMLKHGPVLLAGAVPTLSAVRNLSPLTGLISNTGKTPGSVLRTLLRNMGVIDLFEVTVFSDEVRSRKPDRRIFQHALAELGVEAAQTVHIGDNPWADIDGAKAIGMMAIQVGVVGAFGERRADAYVNSLDEVAHAVLELSNR